MPSRKSRQTRKKQAPLDVYKKKKIQGEKINEEFESIEGALISTLATSKRGAWEVLNKPQRELLKNTIGFKATDNISDILNKMEKYKKKQK